MDLCVLLGSVLLWEFFAYVDSRFYLETTGDNDGQGGHFNVILYKCDVIKQDFGVFEVKCNTIWMPWLKQKVYAVANFNGVSELELLMGHLIKIDGKQITGKLPAVLALGVDPKTFCSRPGFFKPACENRLYIESKVYRMIPLFIDKTNRAELEKLFQFISLNNIAWFFSCTALPAELFPSFAATLERVMKASEALPVEDFPRTVVPKTCYIANALKLRPWVRTKLQFAPQAQSQSVSKYQHRYQYQPPPHSQAQSQPESQYSSPSESESESNIQTPRKKDIMQAVGFLAFKMFDPCFVLITYEESALAESICTTYCQFHSLTFKVYGTAYSQQSENFKRGECVDKACACMPLDQQRSKAKPVRMVLYNNALRLLIYQKVSKYYRN